MPRQTHKKRKYRNGYMPDQVKPKGSKRPRSFHRGPQRDEHFAEAERLMREAEERAA